MEVGGASDDPNIFVHLLSNNQHLVCVHLERKVPLRLNYSKYGGQLTDDNLIRLAALLLDYSTREPVLAVRNIVLKDPEIKVRVCSKAKRQQTSLNRFHERFLKCRLCSADPG